MGTLLRVILENENKWVSGVVVASLLLYGSRQDGPTAAYGWAESLVGMGPSLLS